MYPSLVRLSKAILVWLDVSQIDVLHAFSRGPYPTSSRYFSSLLHIYCTLFSMTINPESEFVFVNHSFYRTED